MSCQEEMTEMEFEIFQLELESIGAKLEHCDGDWRCFYCGCASNHEPGYGCYEGTIEDYYYDRYWY